MIGGLLKKPFSILPTAESRSVIHVKGTGLRAHPAIFQEGKSW